VTPDPNATPAPPTWADVLALVAKLDASGLEDAEIVMDGVSVRVSKSVIPTTGARGRQESAEPQAQPSSTPAASTTQPAPEPPPERAVVADGPTVTAPMLGVLYLRPSPDADPFVKVGDTVTPDTTVAIIEVMKMMNTVTAGVPGTVAEICAKEGQMVEHGDVLVRLEGG
jgi:acetyl-CoA carboxylase biotin carboxyl carrier protein